MTCRVLTCPAALCQHDHHVLAGALKCAKSFHASTVAILAQGTNQAVALAQAFSIVQPHLRCARLRCSGKRTASARLGTVSPSSRRAASKLCRSEKRARVPRVLGRLAGATVPVGTHTSVWNRWDSHGYFSSMCNIHTRKTYSLEAFKTFPKKLAEWRNG